MRNSQMKRNDNYRCETAPSTYSNESHVFTKKEEFLYSHKSSLEILLSAIKKAQISYLSNISNKNEIKINIKHLKELLTELKENLNSMHKEQNSKVNYFQTQLSKQKSSIQKELFFENKNNKSNKNKIKFSPFQNLKTEIEQLKILNFQAQNEIESIDNKILKANLEQQQYLNRSIQMNYEIEKEINCEKQKHGAIITKMLHRKSTEVKKHFKFVVAAKQYQNNEIENYYKNLDNLKHFINSRKNGYDNNYIRNEDIINEESKEYTKSITINNFNQTLNKTLNKLIKANKNAINSKGEESEGSESNEGSSLDSVHKNIKNRNEKEKNKLSNNFINLNMNINLNINFDKIYNFSEDLKYNSDRERSNTEKVSFGKEKKTYASTGSLPYLIIKSIKEETKASGKNIEKDDIYLGKTKSIVSKDNSPDK